MSRHFAGNDSAIKIDTVPVEQHLFYKDELYLFDASLNKLCRIILSNLFQKLAPHLKRSSRSTERGDSSTRFNNVD